MGPAGPNSHTHPNPNPTYPNPIPTLTPTLTLALHFRQVGEQQLQQASEREALLLTIYKEDRGKGEYWPYGSSDLHKLTPPSTREYGNQLLAQARS